MTCNRWAQVAYGEALGSAVLKATAEDFQVDEALDIPLTGDGEHLWLWVEKRGFEYRRSRAAHRCRRRAAAHRQLCRAQGSPGVLDAPVVQCNCRARPTRT